MLVKIEGGSVLAEQRGFEGAWNIVTVVIDDDGFELVGRHRQGIVLHVSNRMWYGRCRWGG